MKPLSYKIHLPTGTVITARNTQELENILNMNVCRVYRSNQIRIEPVWPSHDTGEALGVRRDAIQQKQKDFSRALRHHELDCLCPDCLAL